MKKISAFFDNQKILKLKSFGILMISFLSQKLSILSEKKDIIAKIFIPLFIVAAGYYSCSSAQRRIVQNIQDIFTLSDEIRSFYTEKNDYWGLNTDFVIRNKIVADKFIFQNKLMLSGRTEVLIGSGKDAETVMPLSQNFDIIIPHLNKAQCMSYAEANISDDELLKLQRLSIVNKGGEYIFEWGGKQSLPVKKYATKDFCSDEDNILIWSIK